MVFLGVNVQFLFVMIVIVVVVLILVFCGVVDNFVVGVLIQLCQLVKIGEEIVVEGLDGIFCGVVQEFNGCVVFLIMVDGCMVYVFNVLLFMGVFVNDFCYGVCCSEFDIWI